MGDTEFTTAQVDRAIDHVIDNGACNNGSTIHYSLVFAAAGLAAPQELHNGGDSNLVSKFMEAFHHRCAERDLPPLDALVVHVAGTRKGQPGGGYFRINDLPDPFAQRTPPGQVVRAGRSWEDQKRSCANWALNDAAARSNIATYATASRRLE
ncbi:hypothetical protein [Amycolatopsis sp. NPDC051128]|uniref:hypothetical protein n=1 Tax=Amycolatopsis sp. NPDC051128 TaxID=3155412 RepID=UPI003435E572